MIQQFHAGLVAFYDRFILKFPKTVLFLLILLMGVLAYFATNFQLDASSETLLMEDDADLKYWRETISRYGSDDYVFLTYKPHSGDLFSDETIETLERLRGQLAAVEKVAKVAVMTNVPLLESPKVPIKELVQELRTLASPKVDRELAKVEFKESPLYRNLLVSPDLSTTALQITFEPDATYQVLLGKREALKVKMKQADAPANLADELARANAEFDAHRDAARLFQHNRIVKIRQIMAGYRDQAELFLGGVSMIADDMVAFIKNDLKTFGLGIACFLVLMLTLIFRRPRWVLLPMLCCVASVIAMVGLLGLFGWEVTVISSNFISLQLIITMAITIHLVVRYRELRRENPTADHRALVLETVRLMLTPCFYAAITTIAGFGSLLLCDIRPVINFGWMMSAGILVSLVLTFLIFPTVLMLLGEGCKGAEKPPKFTITPHLARFTEHHGRLILMTAVVVFGVSIMGIMQLFVENSFINYFKSSTEIHQGMLVIDQKLGGTTPLDVIVKLGGSNADAIDEAVEITTTAAADTGTEAPAEGDDFEEFDEFDDEGFDDFESEGSANSDQYWFTAGKMERVLAIHQYLEALPETGKVLSLGTMLEIAKRFNDGKALDNFQMALLYKELPDDIRDMVLTPYISIPNDEVRFGVRIKDSDPDLRRAELLSKIKTDLAQKFDLAPEDFRLTGLMVLYNNMLQSLFSSQISTLGFALAALFIMFLILFRSIKISLIALAPNVLAISFVLGFMGWMKIPLDMMTITIAAISIGIAVDNTIHYVYRFIQEFETKRRYIPTMHHCHGSIGFAMYYTSLTIIIGFSILVLSNFIPSILFGLLTALAMLIALTGAMTLLPQLLITLKPLGPER